MAKELPRYKVIVEYEGQMKRFYGMMLNQSFKDVFSYLEEVDKPIKKSENVVNTKSDTGIIGDNRETPFNIYWNSIGSGYVNNQGQKSFESLGGELEELSEDWKG